MLDNNLFLSPNSLHVTSQGDAYVHNLIAGAVRVSSYNSRTTPFHKAHSTELAGLLDNPSGDERYFNNILLRDCNLAVYDDTRLPVVMGGNVFLKVPAWAVYLAMPIVFGLIAFRFTLQAVIALGTATDPSRGGRTGRTTPVAATDAQQETDS